MKNKRIYFLSIEKTIKIDTNQEFKEKLGFIWYHIRILFYVSKFTEFNRYTFDRQLRFYF